MLTKFQHPTSTFTFSMIIPVENLLREPISLSGKHHTTIMTYKVVKKFTLVPVFFELYAKDIEKLLIAKSSETAT